MKQKSVKRGCSFFEVVVSRADEWSMRGPWVIARWQLRSSLHVYMLLHFHYDCFAVVGGWADGSLARALLRPLFSWVLKTGRRVRAICAIVGMLL